MDPLAIAISGAVLAVALAGIGSAIGVGLAGMAASGVMSEDPQKFGRLMMLVALPGTQGVYGFVTCFLTMVRLGLIGGKIVELTLAQAFQVFFACMPVALAGLVSAIHQGKVCASGVEMTAKQPGDFAKPLIFGTFVELYALLGLAISLLLLFGIKL